MSYEPTNWKSGDTVTSAKLNKMEQGIANAGGGGVLVVTVTDGTLDKTWQEIHDAAPNVLLTYEDDGMTYFFPLYSVGIDQEDYAVNFADATSPDPLNCLASAADDYPTIQPPK